MMKINDELLALISGGNKKLSELTERERLAFIYLLGIDKVLLCDGEDGSICDNSVTIAYKDSLPGCTVTKINEIPCVTNAPAGFGLEASEAEIACIGGIHVCGIGMYRTSRTSSVH